MQVDFTPLGAYRFFGGAVVDLAARMVDMSDVLGREGRRLRERMGATAGWQHRFDLLEDFIAGRAYHLPSPEIAFAYRRLALSRGGARIAALAQRNRLEPQASGRPLSIRTRPGAEIDRAHDALPSGLPAGAQRNSSGWAGIAAESGYADQAHLVREFGELAGETPTAWARRLALIDSRLTRPNEALSTTGNKSSSRRRAASAYWRGEAERRSLP